MDYRIPYAPPDITSGAKLLLGVLQNNREQDRADYNTQINATNANNAFVRESAQSQRETQDFQQRMDDKRRERADQDVKAFGDIVELVKRSKTDPGALSHAMVLGKAHNIDVREAAKKAGEEDAAQMQQAPSPPLPTLLQAALPVQPEATPAAPVSAEPGNELQAMGQAQGQYTGAPLEEGTEGPLEAGDERMHPAAETAEYTPPANVVKVDEPIGINADIPTPPMPPSPEPSPSAVSAPPQMAAATVPQRMNPLFEAVMGGQTYPLGATGSETTGLGEKYDQLYAGLRDVMPDKEARAYVLKQHHEDAIDMAKDKRLATMLGGRKEAAATAETNKETADATYRSTPAEREKLAKIAANSRVASAKASAETPAKADQGNRQDMGSLRQAFKEWKNTVNLAIDSKLQKRLTTASANLNSGNSMQQREAAESLVSIFKGGGQVTKASQDLLLRNLSGIVGNAETWLEHLQTGHYGARELAVLKEAAQNAVAEEKSKVNEYHQSALDTFGPGSGWEALGGNINHMVRGAFRQFGVEVPDVYAEPGEPITLGSGKRPHVTPTQAKPKSALDNLESAVDALTGGGQ